MMTNRQPFTRARRGRSDAPRVDHNTRPAVPEQEPQELSDAVVDEPQAADVPQVTTQSPRAETPGPRIVPRHSRPPPALPEADAQPDMPEPAAEEPAAAPETPAPQPAPMRLVETWEKLPQLDLSVEHLDRQRIITAARRDPAHSAFDVLRTRLLQALAENGWRRVAITSPSKDCGKTFIAANLAISLSRQENCRTVLMDMDLRNPSISKVFGARAPGSMGNFLRGEVLAEHHFHRLGDPGLHMGRNIAVAMNGAPEDYASELLQAPKTAEVLGNMQAELRPDVVLYDLPPALYHDDVIAFRPHIDGVLLVIGGGTTQADEVREVERRLGDATPLLGVIMNKAEDKRSAQYAY